MTEIVLVVFQSLHFVYEVTHFLSFQYVLAMLDEMARLVSIFN